MIGSGVFLLPSSLAEYGSLAIVGWILTSLGAIVLALVFASLARQSIRTGGPYAWTRDGYGEFPGFLIAWGYWIAIWAGNAAIAVAFSGYVAYFVPEVANNKALGLAVALGAIWIVTFINIHGVRSAGIMQVVSTALKMLPLLFIIFIGFIDFDTTNFPAFNASSGSASSGIVACAALTLWAFLGLESATVPADNVENPARTVPLSTVIGVILAALVYILVTLSIFSILPREQLMTSTAPLADAAQAITGAWGGIAIAIGACIATFGTLNGFTLLSGQVPLGAAKDGVFPTWLGKLTKQGTPARALIVSNVLASLLVTMNFSKDLVEQFTFIILLATLTTLVPYIFCALAEIMIWLRKGGSSENQPKISTVVLSGLAFTYSLWAIYGAGSDVVFYGFLFLLAGVPFHVWIKWQNRSKTLLKES
jgi:APA family basic amino acid/polyamine antiporter